MNHTDSQNQWRRRPGFLTAMILCLGPAMLVMTAGFVLSAAGNFRNLLWLPGMVLLALWLGLHGMPLFLRFVERKGWFGWVRLIDGCLHPGRTSGVIELDKPFGVEARFQHSTIKRTYDMRYVTGGRGGGSGERRYKIGVTMLTMVIEQEGRRLLLTADETSRRPGRDYDLEGLNLRRVAIGPVRGLPSVRLWPADLTEILRQLKEAGGYSVARSPVPDRTLEDPRKAVRPLWKTATGIGVVLLVSVILSFGAFSYFQAKHRQHMEEMKAAARAEGLKREARARELLGRRVTIPGREKVRMYGHVSKVELKEDVTYYPEYKTEWRVELTVEIDDLIGSDGTVLPPGAEVGFRHDEDLVRIGSLVEVYPDEVQVIDAESPIGGRSN